MRAESIIYYADERELLNAVADAVVETDVVLDVGCGIVPMNYFRPRFHIMIEPYREYCDVLRQRHYEDKSVLVLRLDALEALSSFQDKSVDSVFLLDVIEHLDKDVGMKVVEEIERVTRRQAIIFTPLGFMPQHIGAGELDAWGLSGAEMQEHKSGWMPEDFGSSWEFHVCKDFHKLDFRGELLEQAYGAFFAVRNFCEEQSQSFAAVPDIRRLLPSEVALQELQVKNRALLGENDNLRASVSAVVCELDKIKNSRTYRLIGLLRRLFSFFKG